MCPLWKSFVPTYTQTFIIIIVIIITLLMCPETGLVGGEEQGKGLSRVYTVCI